MTNPQPSSSTPTGESISSIINQSKDDKLTIDKPLLLDILLNRESLNIKIVVNGLKEYDLNRWSGYKTPDGHTLVLGKDKVLIKHTDSVTLVVS